MIDRSEWQAAAEEVRTGERERLGRAPSPKEVAAYSRGELPEAEMERVRALLVLYPELADPFVEGIDDSDAVLSDEDVAHDWAQLQKRIGTSPVPIESRRWATRILPMAAVIAIVLLGGLLLQRQATVAELLDERNRPRTHGIHHQLLPVDPDRGKKSTDAYPLPGNEENYLLALLLYENMSHAPYRIEIVDSEATPAKPIWSGNISVGKEKKIELSVPRAFLAPGKSYRVNLRRAGNAEPVASYLIRVAP